MPRVVTEAAFIADPVAAIDLVPAGESVVLVDGGGNPFAEITEFRADDPSSPTA